MADPRKILIAYLNSPGADLNALRDALMARLKYATTGDVEASIGNGLVTSNQLRIAIEAFVMSDDFPDLWASSTQGTKADTALQPEASSDVLTQGITNLFLTTAERTRIGNAILMDDIIDGGSF